MFVVSCFLFLVSCRVVSCCVALRLLVCFVCFVCLFCFLRAFHNAPLCETMSSIGQQAVKKTPEWDSILPDTASHVVRPLHGPSAQEANSVTSQAVQSKAPANDRQSNHLTTTVSNTGSLHPRVRPFHGQSLERAGDSARWTERPPADCYSAIAFVATSERCSPTVPGSPRTWPYAFPTQSCQLHQHSVRMHARPSDRSRLPPNVSALLSPRGQSSSVRLGTVASSGCFAAT